MEHEQAIPEKSKQHLAEERTEWAHERTLLAKERTFSAWLRTGLATVATGFGATRLLRTMEPRWIVLVLGAVLIVSGGVIFALAFWRYRLKMDQLGGQRCAWRADVDHRQFDAGLAYLYRPGPCTDPDRLGVAAELRHTASSA